MLRPGGYGVMTCDDGRVLEQDSFTCAHCCKVTFVKPKERPEDLGGLCKCCMGLICCHCVDQPCDVIEKKLKRWEDQHRVAREYGLQT